LLVVIWLASTGVEKNRSSRPAGRSSCLSGRVPGAPRADAASIAAGAARGKPPLPKAPVAAARGARFQRRWRAACANDFLAQTGDDQSAKVQGFNFEERKQ